MPLAPSQYALDGPAKSCWPIAADDRCLDGPGKIEEIPARVLNLSGKAPPIEILNDVPPRQETFRLNHQSRRQERALLDEDDSRVVVG